MGELFHRYIGNYRYYATIVRVKQVVFLCTGNSARSQMAEGWANHFAKGAIRFLSAGTNPAKVVNAKAIAVMGERGIDISSHKPKTLNSVQGPIDLIVAVCSQAAEQCPAPGPEFQIERWDLPDPAAAEGTDDEVLAVFRASRDDIERRVRDLVARL
ncbi:MAG: arsenate reductase ArsC [Nitrospiraceae bacterium]